MRVLLSSHTYMIHKTSGVARIDQCYSFTRITEQSAQGWRDALHS